MSSQHSFIAKFTWHNANPDTIWERLAVRLGREPTSAEAAEEVKRILRDEPAPAMVPQPVQQQQANAFPDRHTYLLRFDIPSASWPNGEIHEDETIQGISRYLESVEYPLLSVDLWDRASGVTTPVTSRILEHICADYEAWNRDVPAMLHTAFEAHGVARPVLYDEDAPYRDPNAERRLSATQLGVSTRRAA